MGYVLSISGPLAATGVLWSANVNQESAVTLWVDDNGGGSTITVETSTDNSTWTAYTAGYYLNADNTLPLNASTLTSKGVYWFNVVNVPYIRFRVSTYVSGNVIIRAEESTSNLAEALPKNTAPMYYNIKAGNSQKIRSALAKSRRGVSNTTILLPGDSTTRGVGANAGGTCMQLGYGPQLAARLANMGLVGYHDNFVGDGNIALATYDSRISLGGFSNAGFVLSAGGYLLRATSVTTLTFTPTIQTDTCEVYYATFPGNGSFNVNVNGGATIQTINENVAQSLTKATISTTLGNNVWNFVTTSTSQVFIAAIVCYNSANKGVNVINAGWSASTSGNWNSASAVWSPRAALAVYTPDLIVMDLGINDWRGVSDLSGKCYETNMAAMVQAAKATGADVWLKTPVPSQVGLGGSQAPYLTQKAVVDTMYRLADRFNVGLIDYWGSVNGDWGTLNARGLMTDTLHPNANGYADIASVVYDALESVT